MAFINGIGLISPQKTAETKDFLSEVVEYNADFLKCIEPVYRNYIDPIQSRRMSRLIKMGIASAKLCLADAGCTMPGAIITGTGLGSVDDTEKILGDITKEEKFLNPTPFIQSTYNTISSQVAIQLKCQNYNSTYVHRTFSFESGLIDGLMQLEEQMAESVLVGAIDEMTFNHLQITRRIGQWKTEPVNNLELLKSTTPGALAGEGAAFILVDVKKSDSTYAKLQDVRTCINIHNSFNAEHFLADFLTQNKLHVSDIDLVILGLNGDINYDSIYLDFATRYFPGTIRAWYKHLCGEYHTATGFGVWAAANILKHQVLPDILNLDERKPTKLRNILIYNQYRNTNHSFILLSAC